MMSISSASLLSGVTVKQNDGASRLSVNKANYLSRVTFTPSGDTVQISSEAWALFRAQSAGNATKALSYYKKGYIISDPTMSVSNLSTDHIKQANSLFVHNLP